MKWYIEGRNVIQAYIMLYALICVSWYCDTIITVIGIWCFNMSKKALWGSFQTDCQVFSVKFGEFSSFPYTQDQEGLPFCPCDETYLSDSEKKAVLFGLLVNFRTITNGSWGKSLLSFLGLALQDCPHTFLSYTKLLLNTHWPSKSVQKLKKKKYEPFEEYCCGLWVVSSWGDLLKRDMEEQWAYGEENR